MNDVVVRRAREEDLARLSVVGPAAYAAAYHHMWPSAADMVPHLETFGEPALREFLAQPGASLWLAETEGMPLGFLSMLTGSPDPVIGGGGGAEIPRIFMLPNATRRGIGRQLIAVALKKARSESIRYLWLDAMDEADWAIASYLNWGFTRVGISIFPKPVAPQFRGMVVFRMELA